MTVNPDDERQSEGWPKGGEATPTLLAVALRAYGNEIRAELANSGMADVPPSGSWVLGHLARQPENVTKLAASLGRTKQAVSLLVDALARAGYVEVSRDPGDRRQLQLNLTDRGRTAAAAIARATTRVDSRLSPPGSRSALRASLRALAGRR